MNPSAIYYINATVVLLKNLKQVFFDIFENKI